MIMFRKRFMLPVFTFLSYCVSSCVVASEKNLYFEYVKEQVTTRNGMLLVGAAPHPKLVIVNGEQVESWGSPYRFNAQYHPSEGSTVLYGYLTDVTITSVETGDVIFVVDRIDDVDTRDAHEHQHIQKRLLGFGVALPEFPYVDFEVSMNYVTFASRDEVFDEGTMKVVIHRDFYKARRRKGVGIL